MLIEPIGLTIDSIGNSYTERGLLAAHALGVHLDLDRSTGDPYRISRETRGLPV